MFEMGEVGIVSIATNSYSKYWLAMVASAYEKIEPEASVQFFLFTDRVCVESEVSKFRDRFKFTFIEIPSYEWPDATIKRYEVIDEHRHLLVNRVLLYLDSDMLIRENFIPDLKAKLESNDMVLILHPGFYRPKGFRLLTTYARTPQTLMRDLRLKICMGGLGSWESRRESVAFVPRRKRKNYVCGGTWFGTNETFLRYVAILRKQVDLDASNKVMAVWHDESHLNKLAIDYKVALSDSRFCFDPRFANLRNVPNLIEAVNKYE
jgi:hypothetical protein